MIAIYIIENRFKVSEYVSNEQLKKKISWFQLVYDLILLSLNMLGLGLVQQKSNDKKE